MKRITFYITLFIMAGLLSACCSAKKAETTQANKQVSMPGPKVIIYQTTKDYSQLVPITLSEDGKTIVSYPDVKDVYYNGNLAYPTKLNNGFLLDNRGIDKNAAFIKLTYDEYAKLTATPAPGELMHMIVDKQPIKSMYSCGIRSSFKDIEQELNSKIDAGNFSSFTKLK